MRCVGRRSRLQTISGAEQPFEDGPGIDAFLDGILAQVSDLVVVEFDAPILLDCDRECRPVARRDRVAEPGANGLQWRERFQAVETFLLRGIHNIPLREVNPFPSNDAVLYASARHRAMTFMAANTAATPRTFNWTGWASLAMSFNA